MKELKDYHIRPVGKADLQDILTFTDRWIGAGYYEEKELLAVLDLSESNDLVTSLGAFYGRELVGIRLTLAPGKWEGKVRGISPHKWKTPFEQVAYFKSLFIAQEHQAAGLGKKLSLESLQVIQKLGGKAVLCHSWLESPNNSSWRYLEKLGFEQVEIHPKYWYPIDYHCPRCGPARCVCTAAEMIKYI